MPSPPEINLNLRYYDWVQADKTERFESHGRVASKKWQVDPRYLGLVLLDVWNIAHLNDVTQRADKITRETIVPLREVFAQHSLPIIHAPSPELARPYQSEQAPMADVPAAADQWPPDEFSQKKGSHVQFQRYSEEKMAELRELQSQRKIHPSVLPRKEEYVAATGEDIHNYCRQKGILILIYVGFSTNFCMISRDYGIVQMKRRGYETILVRDATTGVETADTADQKTLSESVIRSLEMSQHYTMTSQDLLAALAE